MDNFRDSYFQVDWDLTSKRLKGTYWGKQYDTGRGFTVTVINGGQVVAPTTEVLRLKWEKPDNTTGYVNATIVDGKFIVENIDQMFTVHGSVRADFELSVAGEFVASITFYVSVEKAVAVDAVASSSQFTALQDAVGSVDSLQQQFDNVVANVTVDSEVIAARDGKTTLKERLDSDKEEFIHHKLDYAQLEKDVETPIKNMVKNGNFARATYSWESVISESVVSGGVLSNTKTLTTFASAYIRQNLGTVFNNDKIYVGLDVRVTNSDCWKIEIQFRDGNGSIVKRPISIVNPEQNKWYSVNAIEDVGSITGDLNITISHNYYSNQDISKTMDVSKVVTINLTESFGTGNEPKIEYINDLLSGFDGFISGWIPIKHYIKELQNNIDSSSSEMLERLKPLTAENKIINADFSKGTEHWTGAGAKVEDGWLVRTIPSVSPSTYSIYQSYNGLVLGHKYYAKVTGKVHSLDVLDSGVLEIEMSGNNVRQNIEVGKEVTGSIVFEYTTQTRMAVKASPLGDSSGAMTFGLQHPVLIDLTETFGEGNEPSVERVDGMLSKFPNGFFSDRGVLVGIADLYTPQKESTTTNRYNFSDDLVGVYESTDVAPLLTNRENAQSEDVYQMFDDLMSSDSNYVVSKELIFTEATSLPAYAYTFKPILMTSHGGNDHDIPKIIITAGTHGNEKGPVFALYDFLYKLIHNWKDDNILEFFRFNVEFVVVPLVNPWGFNENSRYNSNNVDLNRNFPYRWSWLSNEVFRGDSPASELETQGMMSFFEAHDNAEYLIDFHNMAFRDGYMGYVMTFDGVDTEINEIANRTFGTLGRSWQKRYEFFPQDDNHIWGYTTILPSGTLGVQSCQYGIKGVILEFPRNNGWQDSWTDYDDFIISNGTESLVNHLKGLIKLL